MASYCVRYTADDLNNDERFFYENIGGSYNPATETQEEGRVRNARSYAAAERWASENGFWFEWMPDWDGCSGCECGSDECPCHTGESHETYGCVARDEDDLGCGVSLWSICNPDENYRRVVEAELAAELMAEQAALEAECVDDEDEDEND